MVSLFCGLVMCEDQDVSTAEFLVVSPALVELPARCSWSGLALPEATRRLELVSRLFGLSPDLDLS